MKVTQIKTLGALPLTPQPTHSTEKVGGGGATLKENKKFLILGGIIMTTQTKNTPYQVGDIFYSSWGYEQTNVTFWQIVKLTEKTAWFRPVKKQTIDIHTSMSGTTAPIPNEFIDYPLAKTKDSIVRKRINPNHPNELYGNRSWDTFYRYDGQPVYESSYY